MKFLKTKIFILIVAIIFLLVALNPSYTKFKEFASEAAGPDKKVNYKRIFNGLVFSVYQKEVIYYSRVFGGAITQDIDTTRYLGLLMNFTELKK